MDAIFKKEKKTLPTASPYAPGSSPYAPGYGSLGVIKSMQSATSVYWYHCREQFHAYGDPLKLSNYFYSPAIGKKDNVACMVYFLEKHLKLTEMTSFQHVEGSNDMLWINVSPWWIENPMKHQFFTVALRAGQLYNCINSGWMNTLKNTTYTIATPEATTRFLNGYTHYTGNIRGWQRQFTGVDNNNVKPLGAALKALLQLPPSVKHKRISEIAYSLWKAGGEKQGLDGEYWTEAERQVAKEDAA